MNVGLFVHALKRSRTACVTRRSVPRRLRTYARLTHSSAQTIRAATRTAAMIHATNDVLRLSVMISYAHTRKLFTPAIVRSSHAVCIIDNFSVTLALLLGRA